MELMLRGTFVSILALVVLALGSADAYAATYDFTVTPDPPNEDRETTFRFQGSTSDVDRIRWDTDNDDSFDDGSSTVARRTYSNPGPVVVRMRVTEEDNDVLTTTKTITVNATPAVDFTFTPANPHAGQEVSFSAAASDPEGDALAYAWTFGDGDRATGPAPRHAYEDQDDYTVRLTVTDEHGAVASRTRTIDVDEDPGPTAGFTFAPAEPLTGDVVTFTSTSTPSQGKIVDYDWDLDGDGEFDEEGEQVQWSYSEAGSYLVLLRVRQANGERGVAFATVEVAERPPPADPPADNPGTVPASDSPAITDPVAGSELLADPVARRPRARRLVRMRPFPVVRIAGVVLPRGADVELLSVRAPRGAQIRVRCHGRGCPVGAVARTSATGLVRFSRFERRLRAGIKLELFVRKGNRIGKYTRFLIRAGKAPARGDACLLPGRARPVSCS